MKKRTNVNSLFILVLAIAILVLNACTGKKVPVANAADSKVVQYTCPMHHQIVEDKPGSCPICGMTLVKITGQASEGAGISLGTVLQPVNTSVISNIAAISPVERSVPTQIAAQGYLDFDSRTFNNIAARYSGRIEKLYIKSAFQDIHKGERIYDIYSPEMLTAQQDLIYVTTHSPQETGLLNAARQKLLLLGMTAQQVDQVIKTRAPMYAIPVYSPYGGHVHDVAHSQMAGELKPDQNYTTNNPLPLREGMYVERGQTLFNVVDPHSLWAIIKVSNADVGALKQGRPVQLTLPDVPGMTMDGKVDFIEPVLQTGDKTTTIRVYMHNMGHHLKVNSQVKATINTGSASGIWIPRSALLNLGHTTVVWLKQGSLYKVRVVSASTLSGNDVLITKGLTLTDTIAQSAQYLTDSESFIKIKGNEN